MSRLKDVPELARDGSNLSSVIQSVREVIQTFRGYRGDPLDQALTLRDLTLETLRQLQGGGLINGTTGGTTLINPEAPVYEVDLTPPPTPEGLAASSGISHIYVECASPSYTQGHGHDRTVVYGIKWPDGAPAPVFASAVQLFSFQGPFGAYPSDPATRWALWIKWRSNDGVLSTDPAGGTNGVVTRTGEDVSALVEAMTGEGNPFTILPTTTIIDGVTFPAGTYSTQAFIRDAQITTAKIKDLAVDDAKVASLSAAKLTAGSIGVGSYISSTAYTSGSAGWRINADGTAEFSGVVVRGTVYATAGQIGGITIASNAVRAGQTAYNTGIGFHLGANGTFSLGNSAGNRLTWDGTNLNVVGGGTFSGALSAASGTFAGALSAATGSFSGSLSAATGTFSGNLSAAGGTFSGALSAASGTFSGSLTASAVNAVNTINLAGQAITIPSSAYTAGETGNTVGVVVQTVSFTSSGAPVFITGTFVGLTGTGGMRLELRRNGTPIYTAYTSGPPNSRNTPTCALKDTPGAGAVTYTLYAAIESIDGNTGVMNISHRSLMCLEVKR